MKQTRMRKDGKPWHNNIGPWIEALTTDEKKALVQKATRAQWGPVKDAPKKADEGAWTWPLEVDSYDKTGELSVAEADMLTRYTEAYRFYRYGRTMDFGAVLDRIIRPLNDALDYAGCKTGKRRYVLLFFLRETAERKRTFWAWTTEEWIDSIDRWAPGRQQVVAIAYLLCGFSDLHRLKSDHMVYVCLARKVFGPEYMSTVAERVRAVLLGWGYAKEGVRTNIMRTIFEALLFAGETILAGPYPRCTAEWMRLCTLWYDRSSYAQRSRAMSFYFLLNVGRWLGHTHPEVTSPADWNRNLACELVSVLCQWHGGDWCSVDPAHVKSRGKILAPSTRASRISTLRIFFRDLQEWELIPRRFDPMRHLTAPRSLVGLIRPNPRIIADDIWAKLVWAGLNITAEDLPHEGPTRPGGLQNTVYPSELCRAIDITWLFSGLRNNEIFRLRLGCIRWQREDATVPGSGELLDGDAVCLLDVPVNKTGTAFTKPVDLLVGEAIAAWEKVRPQGNKLPDWKTGEVVSFLFMIRNTVDGENYINRTLIPALCRKAGVPLADVRGNITTHRARSTIASQLFNAKEPMTLFELQEWLGHASPSATPHYAKITPLRLAKSYADAGYFARNLRAIQVLIDQDAVRTGIAAAEPWKFYDLGHGYCTAGRHSYTGRTHP